MSDTTGTPRLRALLALIEEGREARKISTREFARRLGVAQMTVWRWDTGISVPSLDQVEAMLAAVDLENEYRTRLLQIVAEIRHDAADDWLQNGRGISPQLANVIDCDRGAAGLTEWAMLHIPGPLQIGDYARAMFRTPLQHGDMTRAEVDTRVGLRLARRDAVLRRTDPVTITAVICEAALHTGVGINPHTMIDQLTDLLAVAQTHPSVHVRIVPFTANWHEGFAANFAVYQYENGLPPIVYREAQHEGEFLVRRRATAPYERDMAGILTESLSHEESLARIDTVLTSRRQSLATA